MHKYFKKSLALVALSTACIGAIAETTKTTTNLRDSAQVISGMDSRGTVDGKEVIIASPQHVQGCTNGYYVNQGQVMCRTLTVPPGMIAVNTPNMPGCVTGMEAVCITYVALPAGMNSANSGSFGGGSQPGGYLGTDGLLHMTQDESSPVCDCTRVISTTDQKDAAVALQTAVDAAMAAAQTGQDVSAYGEAAVAAVAAAVAADAQAAADAAAASGGDAGSVMSSGDTSTSTSPGSDSGNAGGGPGG